MQALFFLTARTAVTDGTWKNVSAYVYKGVHIDGLLGTDAVVICGSNSPTKPADNTHGIAIATKVVGDLTNGIAGFAINDRWAWMKVRKSAADASTPGATNVSILV